MSDAPAFRSESPPTQWTAIRREFHRRAELSGHESGTAEAVAEHLTRFGARPIVRGLGGHGVAARFDSGRDGARVLLRAELDALPIAESRSLPHHSAQATVSHKCGHDGHLTTLLAVAERLAATPPRAGAVTVLFQPAEETGEGAARVRSDPRWEELAADVAIAWHNLPGQAPGQVILRDDVFAYGSRGLLAEFEGESAHAFEPERAVSPLPAIRRALRLLPGHTETEPVVELTPTHVRIGEPTFGIAPGDASLRLTLRSPSRDALDAFTERCEAMLTELAARSRLRLRLSRHEEFPVTRSDADVNAVIESCARSLGQETFRPPTPLRWSEDFGHLVTSRGAMFGIGAGVDHPPLHSPGYDFPDELLAPASDLLERVVRHYTD